MASIVELEKRIARLEQSNSLLKGRFAIMEHLTITMASVAGPAYLMGLNIALNELMEDEEPSFLPEELKRDRFFMQGFIAQRKGLDEFLRQHRPEAPRDKKG